MFRINFTKPAPKSTTDVVAVAAAQEKYNPATRKQARAAQRRAEIKRTRSFKNDCVTLLNWAADTYFTGSNASTYFNQPLSRDYYVKGETLNDLALRVGMMNLGEFKRWFAAYTDDLDTLYSWLVFVTGQEWPR